MNQVYMIVLKDKNNNIKWIGNYAWKLKEHAIEVAEGMSKDMNEKYTIHTLELNW